MIMQSLKFELQSFTSLTHSLRASPCKIRSSFPSFPEPAYLRPWPTSRDSTMHFGVSYHVIPKKPACFWTMKQAEVYLGHLNDLLWQFCGRGLCLSQWATSSDMFGHCSVQLPWLGRALTLGMPPHMQSGPGWSDAQFTSISLGQGIDFACALQRFTSQRGSIQNTDRARNSAFR